MWPNEGLQGGKAFTLILPLIAREIGLLGCEVSQRPCPLLLTQRTLIGPKRQSRASGAAEQGGESSGNYEATFLKLPSDPALGKPYLEVRPAPKGCR